MLYPSHRALTTRSICRGLSWSSLLVVMGQRDCSHPSSRPSSTVAPGHGAACYLLSMLAAHSAISVKVALMAVSRISILKTVKSRFFRRPLRLERVVIA